MNRRPSDLTTDQLLEGIDQDLVIEDNIDLNQDHNVKLFLDTFNIKQGTDRVKFTTLYRLYKHWSKNPVKSSDFNEIIVSLFEKKHHCVYLNMDIFKIDSLLKKELTKKAWTWRGTKWKTHFNFFLNKLEIEAGEIPVPLLGLYWVYVDFVHNQTRGQSRMEQLSFNKMCFRYFKTETNTNKVKGLQKWILVNKKTYKLIDHLALKTYEKRELEKRQDAKKNNTPA